MRPVWFQVGRWIGVVAAAFWVVVLVGGMLNPSEPVTLQGIALFGLMLTGGAGVVLSFWHPRAGAAIAGVVAVVAAVFATLSAGRNQWLAALTTAGPYAVFAVLTWWAAPRQ